MPLAQKTRLQSKTPLRAKTPLVSRTPLKAKASTVKVKPKRAKLPSRSSLKNKMNALVSKIVIYDSGYRCVQCGSTSQLTNGHVFSRGSLATCYDIHEKGNCYCQCWPCNYRHVRDQWPYFSWFIGKYGIEAFTELRARFSGAKPVKTSELREKYAMLQEEARKRGLC